VPVEIRSAASVLRTLHEEREEVENRIEGSRVGSGNSKLKMLLDLDLE
jgi:hypothetical protein